MTFSEIIWKIIPVGAVTALLLGLPRFFKNRILDIELHANSSKTYCFVLDDERNINIEKLNYYIQLKATIDFYSAYKLDLEEVYFVIKDMGIFYPVDFIPPTEPEGGKSFFDRYEKQWHNALTNRSCNINNEFSGSKDASVASRDAPTAKKDEPSVDQYEPGILNHLVAKGAAMSYTPFSNLPDGGYKVFIIIAFRHFLFAVPCEFASFNDGGFSTISGDYLVKRRSGKSLNLIEISKELDGFVPLEKKLSRVKVAIFDFNFIPWVSSLKSILINKDVFNGLSDRY